MKGKRDEIRNEIKEEAEMKFRQEITSPSGQRCVRIGHFETFWDNSEDFSTSLEHWGRFS